MRVVRSFTNEETEREKFLEGCAEYVSVKNTAHKYMSSFHSMVTLIDGIMYIVVVGVGLVAAAAEGVAHPAPRLLGEYHH